MEHPVQIALASYGMSGQVFHGPFLRVHPGFRVVKILERSKEISKTLFPEARIVTTFDQLLEDPRLEVVIVNTPDRFHYEMARQALQADKHVVVEKPFTFTSAEADELIGLAKDRQKLLTVYQNRRWDSDFLTLKQVMESGVLGQLVEYESHFDRFRTVAPHTWKEEEGDHAGVLYNLGSHLVDQALVLFGLPEAVTAHLRKVRPGSQIFDYFDIRLHYPSFAAILKCSYLVKEEGPRYTLHGTEGSFLKWGIDPQEEALKTGTLPVGEEWGKEPESKQGWLNALANQPDAIVRVPTIPGNYTSFYDNLYHAVRHRMALAVKPQEARDTIRILELCLESHLHRRTIEV